MKTTSPELTPKELSQARFFWYQTYPSESVDLEIGPFLNGDLKAFALPAPITHKNSSTAGASPNYGWLRKSRNALFLSTESVASKLDVSRSNYAKLEKAEMLGTISLLNLSKAAEAMDCELVYGIRPKKRVVFSEIIWSKLMKAALAHPWLKACDQKRKSYALASIAKSTADNPEFRRKQNWSQRRK